MAEIKHGDLVEVDSVLPGDAHHFPFCGTVVALAFDMPDGTPYASVKDQEGDVFDIDLHRLRLVG